MTESLMHSFDKLKNFNREDTLSLLLPFVEKLKNDRDKQEYISVFLNFSMITGEDILRTSVRSADKYYSVMAERVNSGTCADSTRRKHRRIISAFYNQLDKRIESGEDENIPLDYINNFTQFARDVFTEDQFKRNETPQITDMDAIIGAVSNTDKELLIVILLAYQLYLKTGEIAALKVSDFGYNNDTDNSCFVTVHRHSEDINLLVPQELARTIDSYLASSTRSDNYLFCSPDKADSWIRLQQLHLKKICTKLFPGQDRTYSLNNIRNAAASTAVNLGASEAVVAEAMGYRSSRHIRKLSSLRTDIVSAGLLNIKVVNI